MKGIDLNDPDISAIQKKYEGLVRMDETPDHEYECVPTGSAALDRALGIGGLPRGRVVEVFGPESSGKTTLALHVVAEAQKQGGLCAYIDVENALDPVYAQAIGVDLSQLYMYQPDYGEQALNALVDLAATGKFSVIVVDSVAALTPKAEIEGDIGDAHMGLQARLMGQALRKISKALSETNTLCIFINQLREKIGVMFGSPEVTPGGRALKFFSSVRLDIRATKRITDQGEILGTATRVKVAKNKVGIPFKQVEFDIVYGQGISKEGSLLDLAVTDGVIEERKGSWYYFGEAKLGHGREQAKEFLAQNDDVRNEIQSKLAG